MADITRTVEVIFQATDKVGSTIQTISGRLDRMATSVQDAARPLADLADKALKAEAALALLAGAGLAYALSKSIDFESAMVDLEKVLGDNAVELEKAKQAALDFSGTYGVAATDIIDATTGFIQAGFDLNEALTLVEQSLFLVIAGNIEAAQAQEYLTTILKGFKLEAEDSKRVVDILNEVSNRYATNVEELAIGLGRLSPIAKQAGLTLEETAGILTPVIEVFRSGSEAANALKTGLLKLVDDTPAVEAALKALEVSQRDANDQLRPAGEILFDVAEAFKEAEESDKLFLAAQLVGINQAAKMVEVFNSMDNITRITTDALNSQGSAWKEVRAQLESAQIQVDRVVAKWGVLNIAIGDQYLEATKGAIKGTADVLEGLRLAVTSGAFDDVFDLIEGVANNIAANLQTVAQNLPEAFENVDFSGLIDSITDVGGEVQGLIEAFFGEIDLSTPEGLADAIQKLVDAGTAFQRVVAGIIEGLQPFAKIVGDAFFAFVDSDESVQKLAGNVAGLAKGLVAAVDVFKFFISGLELIGAAISVLSLGWLGKLIAALAPGVGGLAGGFAGAGLAAAAFAADLERTEPIGDVVSRTINDTVGGLAALKDGFGNAIDEIRAFNGSQTDLWIQQGLLNERVDEARLKQAAYSNELRDVPDRVFTQIEADTSAGLDAIREFDREFGDLESEKTIAIKAEKDAGFDPVVDGIVAKIDEETGVVTIQASADQPSIDETKKEIDEKLPAQRIQEIKLQGEIDVEIAKIKAQADTLQSAFEWTAKVDIAEIEAETAKIEAAFESINTTIGSTGEVLQSIFAIYGEGSALDTVQLEKFIEKEFVLREKAVALQEQLTEAQIDYINTRTESIAKGEGLITITGDGLQPELEAFMWAILERIQIRANEDQAEFLLGIT